MDEKHLRCYLQKFRRFYLVINQCLTKKYIFEGLKKNYYYGSFNNVLLQQW